MKKSSASSGHHTQAWNHRRLKGSPRHRSPPTARRDVDVSANRPTTKDTISSPFHKPTKLW
jgi:hypothetical protein